MKSLNESSKYFRRPLGLTHGQSTLGDAGQLYIKEMMNSLLC